MAGVDPFTTVATWDLEPVLEVWVDASGGPASVRLAGRLDAATAGHVGELVNTLVVEGHGRVVVDLRDVDAADRRAVETLHGTVRRARLRGADVELARPSGAVTSALGEAGPATPLVPPGSGPPPR